MHKKSRVAAAFVTFIAAPAFAQSFDPTIGTGNIRPFAWDPNDYNGTEAYAQAVAAPKHSAKSANVRHSAKSSYAQARGTTNSQPTVVIVNGKIVGSDPDPFIRLMLKEEAQRGQY
jgi:hypothetical protein